MLFSLPNLSDVLLLLSLTSLPSSLAIVLPPSSSLSLQPLTNEPPFFYPFNNDLSHQTAAAADLLGEPINFQSFAFQEPTQLPPLAATPPLLRWEEVKTRMIEDLTRSRNLNDGYEVFGRFFISGGKIYDSPSRDNERCFFSRLHAAALEMKAWEAGIAGFFAAAGFAWSILVFVELLLYFFPVSSTGEDLIHVEEGNLSSSTSKEKT